MAKTKESRSAKWHKAQKQKDGALTNLEQIEKESKAHVAEHKAQKAKAAKASKVDPFTVGCRACGAKSGEACLGVGGGPRADGKPHPARVEAARRGIRDLDKRARGETSGKPKGKGKGATMRQGVVPGFLDEHDEKIVRAAEDYRQAEGALEDAKRELAECDAHLYGLMNRKGSKVYRDPDGTLVTVKELKAKHKIDVEKVIPTRAVPNPAPVAPEAPAPKAEPSAGTSASSHPDAVPVTQTTGAPIQ